MDFKEKWQGIMGWKKKMSGFNGTMKKGNWIILLCAGLILMILAVPSGGSKTKENGQTWGLGKTELSSLAGKDSKLAGETKTGSQEAWGEAVKTEEEPWDSYEAYLEKRVKEVLDKVEGVGQVDVLIVLKSSEQKVYQTDGKTMQSSTKEQDASGGIRDITEQQQESSTVIINGSSLDTSGGPLLEKELRPEISGIVISAQGGGSASVKSEITDAMVALFDIPPHKVKVLKRME